MRMSTIAMTVLVGVAFTGCGGSGGGGSGGSTGSGANGPAAHVVTSWFDAERLRPQSQGAVRDDAPDERVGEWTWFYDQDGSPIRRSERFAADGTSLGWTEYNADAVDPVTRRGSVRDDAQDAVLR